MISISSLFFFIFLLPSFADCVSYKLVFTIPSSLTFTVPDGVLLEIKIVNNATNALAPPGTVFPKIALIDSGSAIIGSATDVVFSYICNSYIYVSDRVAETTVFSLVDVSNFGFVNNDSLSLSWVAGPIYSLDFAGPFPSTLQVAKNATFVVSARDIAGNVVLNENRRFTFFYSGSSTVISPLNLSNGRANVFVSDLIAENVTVSATFVDVSIPTTGSSPQIISFKPGPPLNFTMLPLGYDPVKLTNSRNLLINTVGLLELLAYDFWGNLVRFQCYYLLNLLRVFVLQYLQCFVFLTYP